LKTVIEFSHRLTSGLAFIAVLVLVIWAFRKFPKGNLLRKTAFVAFLFIITEALVGAGLVLTGNTAETLTAARPFWMIGHLANTFILLCFLTLTGWFAGGGHLNFRAAPKVLLLFALAVAGIVLIGITGSIAALSHMIFPAGTLAEGLQQDFSGSSHGLLRLRVLHPISSIAVGVLLIFFAGWLKKIADGDDWVGRWSNVLSILIIVQIASGAVTLLTGAPILMQVLHLLLADAVWISLVLLAASFFGGKVGAEQAEAAGMPDT
jgi:heme A synthase